MNLSRPGAVRLAGLLVCVCVTTAGAVATAAPAATLPPRRSRHAAHRRRPTSAPPRTGTRAPTNGSPGVDVPKLSGNELLGNTDFAAKTYLPWTTSFTPPGDGKAFLKDGQFCVTVTNKGKDPWDAQARHRDMVIQKGHMYSIRYTAHATKPVQVKTKIGMSGPPHKEYWADTVELTTRPQAFVGVFSMEEDDDATAELAFHFGGAMAGETQAPYTVCFDDIHLDDPKFVTAKKTDDAPVPNVLVNQTGYLPALPKLATIKSASKTPLKWELLKQGGAVVASGDDQAGRHGRRLGRRSARRRFLVGDDARQGLHAEGRRRHEPPVRHRARTLPQAEVRRARVSSITTAAASRSRCRTRAASSGRARPAREREGQRSGKARPTRATRPCRA